MSLQFPFTMLAALAAVLAAAPAHAGLQDENLLVAPPPGYEVGYHAQNSEQLITEMVPKGQSVEDWSEMVTVQIFRSLSDVSPADFRAHMAKQWAVACPGSALAGSADATENGYTVASWTLNCRLNPDSGKPECALFKAIEGRDALYVVQKAFRYLPTAGEMDRWHGYLDKVQVCDTRRPDRACPDVN